MVKASFSHITRLQVSSLRDNLNRRQKHLTGQHKLRSTAVPCLSVPFTFVPKLFLSDLTSEKEISSSMEQSYS
jgi:hypothetical protein